MCTDLHDFWYATLQVNANHTGKFTTFHVIGDAVALLVGRALDL